MRIVISVAAVLAFSFPSIALAAECHQAGGTYVNVSGHLMPDPKCVTTHQSGETAICRDGSHSFSEHHQGTCSRHGGVAQWE